MGVCGEPREADDKGLVRFAALDKYFSSSSMVSKCCIMDGAYRLVRSGDRVEVDLFKAVALDNVL